MKKLIEAKLALDLPLTSEENAYYWLFMATIEEIKESYKYA